MSMRICNPLSRSCRYWVVINGTCFGSEDLPGSAAQIEADTIHRVQDRHRNVANWERFRQMSEAVMPVPRPTLQPEHGITEVSLFNAAELLVLHGEPMRIEFEANTAKNDYFVTAKWPTGAAWSFNGFSWGYGGEGPTGLQTFFDMVGIKDLKVSNIPIDDRGKTDCTWFNPRFGKPTA